jgi:hypothetical protein
MATYNTCNEHSSFAPANSLVSSVEQHNDDSENGQRNSEESASNALSLPSLLSPNADHLTLDIELQVRGERRITLLWELGWPWPRQLVRIASLQDSHQRRITANTYLKAIGVTFAHLVCIHNGPEQCRSCCFCTLERTNKRENSFKVTRYHVCWTIAVS